MRSDWLEEYAVNKYRQTITAEAEVTREHLLHSGVRVTVAKGRSGGGPTRLTGLDVSRLAFAMGETSAARQGG
jgi:hypothetical protein